MTALKGQVYVSNIWQGKAYFWVLHQCMDWLSRPPISHILLPLGGWMRTFGSSIGYPVTSILIRNG